MKAENLIYQSEDGSLKLDVKFDKETVWLNTNDISLLFGKERSVITKHINNLFNSGELEKNGNVQKMHIAGKPY